MILFKVNFKDNRAVVATPATQTDKQVAWSNNPYRIESVEVYANNNIQAKQLAQTKADKLLKMHHA